MQRFEELGDLGEGTYGIVKKCRHKASSLIVAIKKFKDCKEGRQKHMMTKTSAREVQVLQAIRHVNLIRLLDSFRVGKRLHLVFEYMEGTVLQALEAKGRGLGDFETRKIMWQLVRAVDHLHSQDIVHRDIKPENMLLSRDGMMKLCDFGFARYMNMPHLARDMSGYVATRWYRAPELLLADNDYGSKVDIWAIGCMLIEIQTGEPLFAGESDVDQLWIIMKSFTDGQTASLRGKLLLQRMQVPHPSERRTLQQRFSFLESDALQFLEACLHPHPDFRMSCKQLLEMSYFRGVENWFPSSFFVKEDAKAAMLSNVFSDKDSAPSENVQGPPRTRRQKRRAEAASLMSMALNISPLREQRFLPEGADLDQRQSMAAINPAERCADLRQNFADCKEDCEQHTSALLSRCSISPAPKAPSSKWPQIELQVRAGGQPFHASSQSYGRMGAQSISPQRKFRQPQEANRNIQGFCTPSRQPKKRSQGKQGRMGDEFLSPDPRWRSKGCQGDESQSPEPKWRKQGHRDDSRRAPSRMADQSRGPMQQQGKVATKELTMMLDKAHDAPPLQPTRSKIPAFYGKHMTSHQSSPSRWASRDISLPGDATWEPRDMQGLDLNLPVSFDKDTSRGLDLSQQGQRMTSTGQDSHHFQHNKSSYRWKSPTKGIVPGESKLLAMGKSPLRAQAPPFVPMAIQMQGKRAELH